MGGRRGGLRRGRGCVSARGGARDGARWQEWALGTSWLRTSAVDGVRCHQGRQEEKREEKTGNGNSVNNPNYQILLCNFDFSPPRWTQMKKLLDTNLAQFFELYNFHVMDVFAFEQ